MKSIFLTIFVLFAYIDILYANDVIPKKYYNNQKSSIIGFILLNHSRLIHEIRHGDGDYLKSVIDQKQNKLDLDTLKHFASTINDPYQFAKTVADY